MSITLRSLGAAGEVTGSKHLVEVDGTRILVDCGAFQGRRAESDAKNKALLGDVPAQSIHAVVLTHAHFDHCGMLPLLVKRGFTGNIYSTSATRDLANLIMMDSAKIQARDADYLSRQAEKRGQKFDWKPLYDDFDVVKTMGQFVTIDYHRPLRISDGLGIEFYDAGHILGSSLVRMEMKDTQGKRLAVGFSGDLGRKDKPIIRDPEYLHALDYLILESTYGLKLHEETAQALDHLAKVVNETVSKGGKIIIPAFAVERTQELVFILHLLLDQGKIPDVPIWVDSPMAIDATAIFRLHPECYDRETHEAFTLHAKNPFGFAALKFSRSVEESKALNAAKSPMIRNTLLIVGYMAEGTLGRKLKDGAAEVRIHGDFYPVRFNIEEIDAFSAHADWKETLQWLASCKMPKLRKIFLVHGEAKALEGMKEKLLSAGQPDPTIVKSGESYSL
ncbi:MAG: metallo-beta-lactamase family protein [Spirochaetes bacterium]|nr:MAG: metallo-beta-lactamase family protein [Spirochaetota bacterium]